MLRCQALQSTLATMGYQFMTTSHGRAARKAAPPAQQASATPGPSPRQPGTAPLGRLYNAGPTGDIRQHACRLAWRLAPPAAPWSVKQTVWQIG